MTDIRAFSAKLGLDEEPIRLCLAANAESSQKSMPWYVAAMLGVAAWVSSLLAVLSGGFLAIQILPSNDSAAPLTIIGLAFFGAGTCLLRQARSFFSQQFATALAGAGIVLVGVAVFLMHHPAGTAAMSAVFLAGIGIVLTRDATFQALSGATALGFVLFALLDAEVPFTHLWLALPLPIACWLLTHPPAKDLRPLAVAFLFATPIALVWMGYGFALGPIQTADADVWLARAIAIATIGGLLLPSLPTIPSRGAALIAALLLGIILPPAGSAGLAILALAYILGSRLLAVGGIIVTGYVLNAFYYDLDTSLPVKAGILVLAGCVFLGAWYLLGRKGNPA